MEPKELLAKLVGEEGPPATLYVELAAKYGLPLRDGEVPLSTELHVVMNNWRIHLLDPVRAGFPGAIGLRKLHDHEAWFGLWERVPQGCKEGYILAGESHPVVQVFSGEFPTGIYGGARELGTRLRFESTLSIYGDAKEKKFWEVACETIHRALELSAATGNTLNYFYR